MERKSFQLAVIGSGPGGYVAAIKAAQLGLTVALIERGPLGGTCLNVGCIPTKTLLSNASVLHTLRKAAQFGIKVDNISIDYAQMKGRKDQVIAKIRTNLEGLIKANKVEIVRGTASFESPHELKIVGQDNLLLHAEKIILATGSIPTDVRAFPCDHKRILNSTSLLELTELPKRLAIIGGGYIGCEFASLFAELGTQVSILEALPTILQPQGTAISQFMTRSFTQRGIALQTGVSVQSIASHPDHVTISLSDGKTLEADYALVAIGRKPYTTGLNLNKAGLAPNEKGFLDVNEQMETSVAGLFAIGDVTGKAMLAHVASHQGLVAAAVAAGRTAHIDYRAVPAVVFTDPEISTVGLTLEQAQAAGYAATAGTFPFQALGKAQASLDLEGFATVISDTKTGQILGAQVVGHEASNLIAPMALAIQNELTLDCIIETIHAHPTLAESLLEASFLANNTPLHLPPKKR